MIFSVRDIPQVCGQILEKEKLWDCGVYSVGYGIQAILLVRFFGNCLFTSWHIGNIWGGSTIKNLKPSSPEISSSCKVPPLKGPTTSEASFPKDQILKHRSLWETFYFQASKTSK